MLGQEDATVEKFTKPVKIEPPLVPTDLDRPGKKAEEEYKPLPAADPSTSTVVSSTALPDPFEAIIPTTITAADIEAIRSDYESRLASISPNSPPPWTSSRS